MNINKSEIRRRNRRLKQSISNYPIQSAVNPFITKKSKILTLGSCFTIEIKQWFIKHKFKVYDAGRWMFWYNTYTILAEFERVVKKWKQSKDDVWHLEDGRWQDPYRRCIFAFNKRDLLIRIRKLDKYLKRAIIKSNVIIITLGLTEVFVQKNGRIICATPGYANGGGEDCAFFASGYDENYRNLSDCIKYLRRVNPSCKVILTVSPMPLVCTFRNVDHLIANTASKSILRSVADKIVEENDNVSYFHSYELVACDNRNDVYKSDGRHVKSSCIDRIMIEFDRLFIVK